MNSGELFEALRMLANEKNVPLELIVEKIQTAITIAVKKDYAGTENVVFEVDPVKGKFDVFIQKEIIELDDDIEDDANQIALEEALKINKRYKAGGQCLIKLDTKQFGRIAAQTAKQVMKQGIRDAEHTQLLERWGDLQNTIVTARILRVEEDTGNAIAEIGGNEIMFYKNEQIPDEVINEGDNIKVYVSASGGGEKRTYFKITRTNEGFIKKLFELEVPEIGEGTIEIKAVSRAAGSRSKIAVWSNDKNVEAVGACIGPKRRRIGAIRDAANGEKIDIIPYDEVPEEFVKNSLKPAAVTSVMIEERPDEKEMVCTVIVPENQLSLAIGNKGQNAKLAARLTGYKIDIKPETDYYSTGED